MALLRSYHEDFKNGRGRGGSNSDGLHTLAHIMTNMAKVYPEDGRKPPWQSLFEQDIIPVVVQLLCDLDFNVDIERHGLTATVGHPDLSSF